MADEPPFICTCEYECGGRVDDTDCPEHGVYELTVTLDGYELDLLHNCIAGEAARILVHDEVERLEAITNLGRKLGMKL